MADFENFAELIAKYNSTLPTLSDGQASELQVSSDGHLLVTFSNTTIAVTQSTSPWVIGDGGGSISIDDNGGSITVDGTVSISGDVNVTQGTSPWVVSNQVLSDQDHLDGAAWAAGSHGFEALAVRKDASGPFTGVADGDFSPLQLDSAGALKVSGSVSVSNLPGSGTEEDKGSDEAGDGLVTLTAGPDVIVSIPVPTGTLKIYGWSWSADRQCTFRLEIYDDTTLVKIIRTMLNSGSIPGDSMEFGLPIEVAGGTNIVARVSAVRVNGNGGSASAGINAELV